MPLEPCTWINTHQLCAQLPISRVTLHRWRRRGLLREGQHWVRKNPCRPHSDQLWQLERCAELLRRTRLQLRR